MNIMSQITRKNMVKNKKRTTMTILGVIISVAMITAVASAATSFLVLMQKQELRNTGNYHIEYTNVPVKEIDQFENDASIGKHYLSQPLSYAKVKDVILETEYKPYVYIEQLTSETMEEMHVTLIEGRLPETKDELVISTYLNSSGGLEAEVGDTITLELGDRYIDEYTGTSLTQKNYYNEFGVPEKFHINETKTYTVVGIMERPGFEPYGSMGYTAITYLDGASLRQEEKVTVYTFLNRVSRAIYAKGSDMAALLGITENDVIFNDAVLRYYGVSRYDSFNTMVTGLSTILILIIMVGSISLIYNSFAISITERSKQFGMLSSVGATKKQKRHAVYYEGAVIGIIAIPLGILAGLGGMGITFKIVTNLLSSSMEDVIPLTLYVSGKAICVAIIFSILTIYISALIPARRASKISAIDAIRQTNDIKMSGKAIKTNRLVRRIFGVEGELALKNLKRNKKRFRALVFSLVISLVLFISVGSYVFFAKKSYDMSSKSQTYDIGVHFYQDGIKDEIFEAIKALDSVIEATKTTTTNVVFQLDPKQGETLLTDDFIEASKAQYSNWGWSTEEIEAEIKNNGIPVNFDFIALDDDSYEKYLKQLGLSNQVDNQGQIQGILVNKAVNQIGYSLTETSILKATSNQEIPVLCYDIDSEEGISKNIIPVELIGVTDRLPRMGVSYGSTSGSTPMIISERMFRYLLTQIKEIGSISENVAYFLDIVESDTINHEIDTIMDGKKVTSYYINNRFEQEQQMRLQILIVSIFVYGFITLISLICIANLCNTISTSFALRRREFAMLKSVGMEPKVFNRMIRFESLFYGLKALMYGLPISLVTTVAIYRTVNENFTFRFVFPWTIYLIGIVSVFFVVGISMVYAGFKIKGEAIIDGLKSENS